MDAEIPNALIKKGLRPRSSSSKVIILEIPNALIQKGLRLKILIHTLNYFRNTECPDSKGIKTVAHSFTLSPTEIPNALIQKGLRLARCSRLRRQKEIPNALIQKGLRLFGHSHRCGDWEIPNALIQKGLRRHPSDDKLNKRNTECPDSKGIKTPYLYARKLAWEIPNALIQKGLRLTIISPVFSHPRKYRMP